MALAFIIFAAASGLFAIRIGLRGRQVDDHPLCAGCGFDLTGTPESSGRCSECGANLRGPKALQIGHRRRRSGWVIGGVVLALLAATAAGLMVADEVGAARWIGHVPVKWLLLQAQMGTASSRGDAVAELLDRAKHGTLSAAQVAGTVGVALAMQGNPNKAWDSAWGDFIEFERFNKGQVSNSQWAQYGRQGFENAFVLRTRPVVRIGDPLPYWLDLKSCRVATNSILRANFGIGFSDLSADYSHDAHGLILGGFNPSMSCSTGSWLDVSGFPAGIGPGLHRVRFTARIEDQLGKSVAAGATTGSGAFDLTADIRLLPADDPSVKGVKNPQIADLIQRCVNVRLHYDPKNPGDWSSSVAATEPPAGVSFIIYVVVNGKEVRLGSVACPAGATRNVGLMGHDAFAPLFATSSAPKGATPRVTLILHADPEPAIRSTDVFDYWDGTIELKDVTVQE